MQLNCPRLIQKCFLVNAKPLINQVSTKYEIHLNISTINLNNYRISSSKCRSSNKRWPLISAAAPLGFHIEISPPSNKRPPSKCGAYQNSYYILLVAKPKCIWKYCGYLGFQCISFIDSEKLCFLLVLKKKNKILTSNILYFANFEISASL